MSDQAKGLLLVIAAVLFIVPDSLFVRLIEADTATVLFWRSFLTFVALTLWLYIRHGNGLIDLWRNMTRAHLYYAIGLIGSTIFFVMSVRHTSVANTVFILASTPIFAAIYSRIFLGERIGRRMAATIFVVLVGVSIIAFGSESMPQAHLFGDFLALLVAMFFAAAMTVARAHRDKSMTPVIPLSFLVAALLFLPFATPFGLEGPSILYTALHGGIFIPAAMALFAIGPRYISSAEVSLLILGESVLAPILVWVVIGEDPGRMALIGGAIVLGALFFYNLSKLRRA